jgi:hypothetical protein
MTATYTCIACGASIPPASASNAPDDPGFVHSPGYPQDDGEHSAADELTDTGYTYRELNAALRDAAYIFQDDNRPTPAKSQRGECPIVVRVPPILGDVDWDSGNVSWRKGWHARGWRKVRP